jgi:hypothetical protein
MTMKVKIIFCMFALVFYSQIILAQKDSSYFPLAIGNYWEMEGYYTKEYYDSTSFSTKYRHMPYNLKIQIIGDTAFANHKSYFILDYHGEISDSVIEVENHLEYLRKDSIGDVYKYLPTDNTDYLLWKFSGKIEEIYYNKLYSDGCIIRHKDNIQIIFTAGYFFETKSFSFVQGVGCYTFGHVNHYNINHKKLLSTVSV